MCTETTREIAEMYDLQAMKDEAFAAVLSRIEIDAADVAELLAFNDWIDAGAGCWYLDIDLDGTRHVPCAKIVRGVVTILI